MTLQFHLKMIRRRLFLHVLFLSLLLFAVKEVAAKPTGINRQDRAWKMKITSCENEDCGHLVPETAYNCVNQCVSPSCFETVYASSPLEDGEIDTYRNREFIQCVRKEYRGKVKFVIQRIRLSSFWIKSLL